MKIHEVAVLTGVTVRTLHYYDEIGLLKPEKVTDAGYRMYDAGALEILQQILFFRELDFPLKDIQQIMQNPHYDKAEALGKHRELLMQKRDRLNELIALVENTIKGDVQMSFKEFDMAEIEANKQRYAQEVEARWGKTDAYRESAKKTARYDAAQWKDITGDGAAILKAFGESRHLAPESEAVRALVVRWQAHITTNFYACSKEMLSCLGEMYVGDERFTENIDQNGCGTAAFIAKAIRAYCAG